MPKILAALLLVLCATPLLADERPTEQSLGFYSDGSLLHAANLGLEAEGFVKLFQPRNRGWLNDSLKAVLLNTAQEIHRRYPNAERLQAGDIAAEKGGDLSGHASHQNGLDADLVYYRMDHREMGTQTTQGFDETFVTNDKVTRNFDAERNWEFLKLLAAGTKLNRIFMDPAIKRTLCLRAAALGKSQTHAEVLRHLSPYDNHANHMHVRIHCPLGNPRCKEQQDPPVGSGCDRIVLERDVIAD